MRDFVYICDNAYTRDQVRPRRRPALLGGGIKLRNFGANFPVASRWPTALVTPSPPRAPPPPPPLADPGDGGGYAVPAWVPPLLPDGLVSGGRAVRSDVLVLARACQFRPTAGAVSDNVSACLLVRTLLLPDSSPYRRRLSWCCSLILAMRTTV